MNEYQENQLLTILSDFIPLMAGDIIQGISPEALALTRQKVLEQLQADREELNKEDASLVSWQEDNIQLLQDISDDEFQAVLEEQILLTELKIGQSIFQELDSQQLTHLGEQLKVKRSETGETDEEKSSFFNRFSKHFRMMIKK